MIRIGIVDREEEYSGKLAVFLNRCEKSLWNTSAFTEKDILIKHMKLRGLDILASADFDLLMVLQKQFPKVCYVWLTDERGSRKEVPDDMRFYTVYRYQSARVIADSIRDIVEYTGLTAPKKKKSAVMYSPVGRCGKTGLAKAFVNDSSKWLYIGMEDYGGERHEQGSDFLYYLKERKDGAVVNILSSCEGIIPSPFSLFDTRLIDREDIAWFIKLFEGVMDYQGFLVDMGTGILRDYQVLSMFDHVIVPYIEGDTAAKKCEQLKELIKIYELFELSEKLRFINMDSSAVPAEELKRLLLG